MGNPNLYGLGIARSEFTPRRSVLEVGDRSRDGNTVVRVGRENTVGPGWSKTEHIVVTPEQLPQLIADLSKHLP